MAYVITEACIGVKDSACVAVCPVDCIHPTPAEDAFATIDQLYIDPLSCIDCGACQVVCPVSAIFPEDEVPAHLASYIEKNRLFYAQRTTWPLTVASGLAERVVSRT